MHFDKADLPATKNGIWSISAYRENFYESNPINRYGLLPAMVKYNPDGSGVYLQGKSAGIDKESNWLPVPQSGLASVTLRVYDHQKTKQRVPSTKSPAIRKVQ